MPAPAEIQQDQDAAWAIRFRERGTNAAARVRGNRQDEQIGAADYNLRQKQAQDNEAFLQSKAGAGARDLMQQRNVAENQRRTRDLAEQSFQFDQEKRQFDDEYKIGQQQIAINAERRRMNEERRKMDRDNLVISHTDKAEEEMDQVLKSGLVPGSPGFAAATMQVLLNSPHLEKSVRDTFLQTARIEGDPDLIVGQAKELGLEPSGARVVNGKLVPTFKKPAPDKTTAGATAKAAAAADPEKQIREARKEWLTVLEKLNKAGDDEDNAELEAEARILKDNLDRLRGGSTNPAVAGAPRAGTAGGNPPVTLPKVTSREQFNALPPGSQYINSAGQTATKPNEG